jgi:Cu-Zn family superoxide dismutase
MSDPQLKSVGPHFNPSGHKHGGADTVVRHAGDLGNITANDKGIAIVDIEVKGVTLKEGAECIVGRSIIVHASADDLATDPAGNSGGRIAGGVIELNK